MKLRNKKTGEIGKILKQLSEDNQLEVITDNKLYVVRSLAELNEEWCDVLEEPKEYWSIDCFVPDGDLVSQFSNCSESVIENRKSIGNYFETKEEAEEVVRKLKAWKRLKDNGVIPLYYRFTPGGSFIVKFGVGMENVKIKEDLDLLFSQEDD